MKLVGLTGGIACGKSTFSQFLTQSGVEIIDCDLVARDVVRKGTWGYRRVLAVFGRGILQADGELDRDAIGNIVFHDSAARRRLNAATHLPVLFEILRQAAIHWLFFKPMVVIDMPLLFETGFYRVTRPNILVACSEDMQLMRLAARDGLGREAAEARIRAQMPLEQKATLANIIVNNDGSVEELRRQAEDVVQRLKRGSWLHLSLFSPAGALLLIFGAWRWLQ